MAPNYFGNLVICDWDGVAVDANPIYYGCLHESFFAGGVNLDPLEEREVIQENWGGSGEIILKRSYRQERIARLFKNRQALEKALEISQKVFNDCYHRRYPEEVQEMVPGAFRALGELASGNTLTLATAAKEEVLRNQVFPKFGIDPERLFAKIVEVGGERAKPDPRIVDDIREEFGSPPESTYVVGDSEPDMEMAKQAGVLGIAVETGILTPEVIRQRGFLSVRDITYLPKLIGSLTANSTAMH